MIRRIFVFCFLISVTVAHGQINALDSLKMDLRKVIEENKSDTAVATSYFRLAQKRENKDPDYAVKIYLFDINFIQNSLDRIPDSSKSARAKMNGILAGAYNNLARIYGVNKEFNKAIEYDSRSLEIYTALSDKYGMADALGDLAEMYFLQGNLPKAKEFATLSLDAGKDIGELDLIKRNSILLQKALRRQGRLEEAFAANELYFQLRDSVRIRENRLFTRSERERLEMQQKAVADSVKYIEAQREILHLRVKEQNERFKYLIVGISLLVVLSIVGFILYYRKRKADFTHEVLETKMKALRAQMNPHFIFNVLNSIQYFAGENDLKGVQHYLRQLSKLMRMILDQARSSFIVLEQVITMQKLYLELEKMRFENKFSYVFEVEEGLDTNKILIPDMLIQPIIENAIKHGIEHKEGEAEIKVSFYLKSDILICTVSDNGIGRTEAKRLKEGKDLHTSTATSIIEERMAALNALYGIHLEFRTLDLFDHNGESAGTSVVIELPIRNIKQE